MGWAIGIGLLVVAVAVFGIVRFIRSKGEHDILQRLRPGVRFKAHDDSGATIIGECIKVTDSNTVEALYTKGGGSHREKGPIPVHKIFSIGS